MTTMERYIAKVEKEASKPGEETKAETTALGTETADRPFLQGRNRSVSKSGSRDGKMGVEESKVENYRAS